MNTKTMEGLVGANANINLINTPFKVYKDAERRGDTATMERAMGYVVDFSEKAYEYKAEADKGMKEDAKETKEQAKAEREKAIEKRREEREKLEDRIEETRTGQTGTEDGKTEESVSANKETDIVRAGSENTVASANTKTGKEPVIYTKTGEVSLPEQTASISVSV